MKMKKLLKNAVVYAVAASMLVATPLTASAGLRDVYKVTDGSGNVISGDPEEPTGTVTNTYTDTTVLKDNDPYIIGISLDQTSVKTVKGEEAELRATVLFDGNVPEAAREEANKLIRWETSDLWTVSVKVDASDRTVAYLTPRKGTAAGKEVEITASIGNPNGESDYDFTFKDEEGKEHHVEGFQKYYEAKASVYVKEYTETLSFKSTVKEEQLANHKLDLGAALVRSPETANDTITWSSSNTSVATVTATGVVTFKLKKNTESAEVVIRAAGEMADKKSGKAYVEKKFVVKKGIPATGVTITKVTGSEDDTKTTKGSVDLGAKDGDKSDHTVTLTATMSPEDTTDVIEWTSSKTAFVEVITYDNDEKAKTSTVQLKPLKPGTSTITAKASNGKKATYKLTVKATLKDFEIIGYTKGGKYYAGQTLQLDVKTNPSVCTTKVTWALDDAGKSLAKINSKGLLTIKAKASGKITVTATSKDSKKIAKTADINVTQSEVNKIEVTDNVTGATVASYYVNDNGVVKKTTSGEAKMAVNADKSRTFTATVDEKAIPAGDGAKTLNWKTSNAKVATVVANGDGTASITALKAGTATITVSGVYNKKGSGTYKPINAIFKVKVTQPITTMTMNKPSVVAKATGKTQSISLSVKKNKGAKGTVTWTATKNGVKADVVSTKGKVTLKKNEYAVGDVFVITATADTGVKARSVITVKKVTDKVTLKEGTDVLSGTKTITLGEKSYYDITPYITVKENGAKVDYVAGKDGTEGVTYTVSKSGVVSVVGNQVYIVGTGKAKITAKTATGKKASFTVKVNP